MAKLFCNNPFFAEYPLRMGKYILMSGFNRFNNDPTFIKCYSISSLLNSVTTLYHIFHWTHYLLFYFIQTFYVITKSVFFINKIQIPSQSLSSNQNLRRADLLFAQTRCSFSIPGYIGS